MGMAISAGKRQPILRIVCFCKPALQAHLRDLTHTQLTLSDASTHCTETLLVRLAVRDQAMETEARALAARTGEHATHNKELQRKLTATRLQKQQLGQQMRSLIQARRALPVLHVFEDWALRLVWLAMSCAGA